MEPSQYLPNEAIFDLLLSSDFDTIINLCQTSATINNVCQDDHLWQQKLLKDFGDFPKLQNKTWRQSYETILKSDQFLNYMIEGKIFLLYEFDNIEFINQIIGFRT